MGDNKETSATKNCGEKASGSGVNSDINCGATTSCTDSSSVKTGNVTETAAAPRKLIFNELLTVETKYLLKYLTTASPTDKSINAVEFDAKIDKVIAQIEAKYKNRRLELSRQKRSLTRKKNKQRKRSRVTKRHDPERAESLAETADTLESEVLDVNKQVVALFHEKDAILKKLNSLRRIIPVIDITGTDAAENKKTEDTGIEKDQAIYETALEITEQDLPIIPIKSVTEIVKEETKDFLQYLTTDAANKQSITIAEHNSKIDKAVSDIVFSVEQHTLELHTLRKSLAVKRHKITERANYCKTNQLLESKIHLSAASILTKKSTDILEHIKVLANEKRALISKLSAQLKAVPLAEGEAKNWHAQTNPSGTTQVNLTFEGQPVTAIVVGKHNPESVPSEESAFLKRLIRLRKCELQYCEKQRSIDHACAEKAHAACYELLAEITDLITPVLEPENVLRRKGKLLNVLLERYPPKFSRVEVTLSAADVDHTGVEEKLGIGKLPLIPANTTVVTTSDGGSHDENERNFTRRLNTIIEFQLGAARTAAAKKDFVNAKVTLALASALIAKPRGFKEVLDQLIQQPDVCHQSQDNISEELAHLKESTIIVESIIRDLHRQIEPNEETNVQTQLPSSLDRNELIQEAERCKFYLDKQTLAEYNEGRKYSTFGNLLIAGAKCILGSDLGEKAAHLNHALHRKGGPDLATLNSLVKKYKPLVPEDYVPSKPTYQPRFTVPRDPPPPPKPSAPVKPPKKSFIPPVNAGPAPGNLSVKELTERVFGTPAAVSNTEPERTLFSFRELRSLGMPIEDAKKLCKKASQNTPKPSSHTEPKPLCKKPLLDTPKPSSNTEPEPLTFEELRSMGVPLEDAKKLCKKPLLDTPTSGNWRSTQNDPNKEPELKEFEPQLPKGFQKIKLPKVKKSIGKWYPLRFEPTPKDNTQEPNQASVSGLPSEIKLVAGDANKPTLMSGGGQSQWNQPANQKGSGIKVLSSSNIVINMLPGQNPAPPESQPSGNKPAAKQPLLSQPLQSKQQSGGTLRNPVQYLAGPISQSQGQVYIKSPQSAGSAIPFYPRGVPKSFLAKQQQLLEAQNEAGYQAPNPDNMPIWPTQSGYQPPTFTSTFTEAPSNYEANTQMFVQTDQTEVSGGSGQNMFADDPSFMEDDEIGDGSQSPTTGQKRLSAFQRLGPVAAPKKPKLTINLLFSKDDSVRRQRHRSEVVDEQAEREKRPDKLVPVHQRQDILSSIDETVITYLAHWPWKINFHIKKTAGPRASKSSMIMEEEQMVEGYESNRNFIKVAISKFPPHYKKEDVLDLMLETVSGKSFIPCFIEFTRERCMFLVLRSHRALLALHKKGLFLHENGCDMPVHISLTDLTLNNIGFIPRIVLGKRLTAAYDGEMKLDLEAFCLKSDISHFIYFPLNRPTNQAELVQLQSGVSWEYITELNLAKNRLTTIDGFDLARKCPKLSVLDLSTNYLEKISALLSCRGVSLKSLRLEGNPLCTDYTDPAHYVRVLKMMFPTLIELDGVKIQPAGELPLIKQNYCPDDARGLVEKFLDVYFPLLDSAPEDRMPIEELYHEQATLTITYRYNLRYRPIFRHFRDLFTRCRLLEEENLDSVEGAPAIAKHASRWPSLKHDPFTFVIDVLHHDESTTILRIAGVLKITSESLAEDEHLLSFTRTLVLRSHNGFQYKIHNEMLYWDEVSPELGSQAFQITTIKSKKLSLKMESAPDDDLKEKLIAIFMKVTNLNRKLSERCLEIRNWDFRAALEYFMKLLKLNSLDTLDVTED